MPEQRNVGFMKFPKLNGLAVTLRNNLQDAFTFPKAPPEKIEAGKKAIANDWQEVASEMLRILGDLEERLEKVEQHLRTPRR